ncbi:MAG TPA: SAM-dependent methyltransferase [Polyangia bacterium]|nr:SAM-dependent methyltransferase [Polyangia bacterium]
MKPPAITGVPDTAFMVAAWRAVESERPDALFRDPYAVSLAGARGLALADHLSANQMGRWQVVVRTVIIDRMVRAAVEAGATTVLNLGAGLDARPYRLDWPSSLRWIEVDFPEVIAWKDQRLQGATPTCRLERVPLDLTDTTARRSLFARAGADSARTLVLTEGVVPYLTNEAVGALADDLRRIRGAQWIVDYISPEAVRFRKRLRVSRQMRAAPFQFAPPDWFDFFEAHGWRPRNINYLPIEARQLGRPAPLPRWIRLAMRATRWLRPASALDGFRKSIAYVLLEPLSEKQM